MLDVTAAIIEREGKYLIAKRKKGKFRGKWEFPGGKIEGRDKTPEECLRRELMEEFGIESIVKDFFGESIYNYSFGRIRLIGYNVDHISGDFSLRDHDEIKWVSPDEMKGYDFIKADLPFVDKLINS
jgi:8-oxo-dGTP diphosphatase